MFKITFPISKVTTFVFLPPLITFVLAYFGAMAGVTGAFLLLPFQLSVLGYTAPGVSATNFLYNIFAIPGTVFRYAKEGRMNWPLAFIISIGGFPGIVAGYFIRVKYLVEPRFFKPFVGLVLLYLVWRIGENILRWGKENVRPAKDAHIKNIRMGIKRISYIFDGKEYSFDPRFLFFVSVGVGVVGGAYGIGGGAVLAPFCISVLRLPVHSVAGASLFGTLVCSVVGVAVYHTGVLSGAVETRPDYLLGILFGMGGVLGGYLGAKTQKHMPELPIKIGLFVVLSFISMRYILAVLN